MGKYDKIIDMPHHVSTKRRHMSNAERAKQFAPFAALKPCAAFTAEPAENRTNIISPYFKENI